MKKLPLKDRQAYLITDKLTQEYLSGIKLNDGVLIYCGHTAYFIDARYFSAVKSRIEEKGLTPKLYLGLDSIKQFLEENKIIKLYLDFDKTTLSEFNEYKVLGVKLLDGSSALKRARSIKDEFELENVKKACKIAQTAMQNIQNRLTKGVTENEIKNLLEKDMLSCGADDVSFDTIVAFGKNSAVPHHETGDSVLEENSVVLIDMGCKVKGYCSDITRTFFYGEPTERFINCYNAVLKANLTAIDNIKDGDLTNVCDGYARSSLKEDRLAEYFTHSLGHGVGLEIHEFPTLSPKKSDKLENGMVFTIEPGVYFDGEFGIRIEDTVVLENGKVKRLFSDDKKLKKI